MTNPTTAPQPRKNRRDERLLVVEEVFEDVVEILTIACEDTRFTRFLEGDRRD